VTERRGEERVMTSANRNYKASLFSDYFSDKKRLIEAYNAIAGTNYPDTAEVEFQTIENVLFAGVNNDIAFTIEGRYVVLIEHQSTINENMPLRLLMYMAHIYEAIVPRKTLYYKSIRYIPTPQFIVIYNGTRPYPERSTLHLSDAYIARDSKVQLELSVPVYNMSEGYNAEILSHSKALSDYSAFVTIVGGYEAGGLSRVEAIEKAVYECTENGIMKTYLEVRGAEVRNMLITEWDNDEAVEVAREEGMEIGRDDERSEIVKKMRGAEMSDDEIASITQYPLEFISSIVPD
jgi:hypothetical protein